MMVGNEVQAVVRAPIVGIEDAQRLLEIRNLSRKPATPFSISLKDINLDVRAGEVIGIAGVAGNGQGEFFEIDRAPGGPTMLPFALPRVTPDERSALR